jgi:acetolactate synthase I/II/III large subunit
LISGYINAFLDSSNLINIKTIYHLMTSSPTLRCADALARILESEGVKFVFGHPGEQILPLYDALRESKIKHVLMRHEQGAAHAADGYARASGKFGVCVASGGPGAMNLIMGVATAYKDSVPLLVITGDVSTEHQGQNMFQEIDVSSIFSFLTLKTFNIKEPEQGILNVKKAIKMLKNGKTGPIHLNFPKDVLEGRVEPFLIHENVSFSPETDIKDLDGAISLIENSKRPLILAGAGVIWSNAGDKLFKFLKEHEIPLTTTYPARGILPEDHPLSLGMLGLRGTDAANFAGENCDVLLILGSRLSERTRVGIGNCQIVQVNLDKKVLKGDFNIQEDVGEFLEKLSHLKLKSTEEWLSLIQKHSKSYDIDTDYNDIPIKPQQAIKEILDSAEDSLIVNDAGTHTTWVTLLKLVREPSSLIFSGGFGPMGYAVPAAIGVSIARPEKSVVAIVGDGGFQMTSQELATIAQLNLPIVICILNNSSLRIIKQWQELYYGGTYQVELENPDFVELARSYHFHAQRVNSPGEVYKAVGHALKLERPYLIEVMVDKDEGIPLPDWGG